LPIAGPPWAWSSPASPSLALAGQRRFIRVQQALRHGEPLPSPTAATLLPFGIAIIGACGLAAAVAELTS
jgi:hypothetical protein